jgi:hypothetical protein
MLTLFFMGLLWLAVPGAGGTQGLDAFLDAVKQDACILYAQDPNAYGGVRPPQCVNRPPRRRR